MSKLFPVSTIIVIVMKNIIAVDTILIRTNNNILITSLKKFEIVDETIGSIITSTIL